jgi:Tol biopolymer transport system component
MTLAAGTRLGPYEIVAPLGAGGMGEVWRVRDIRLDREVALKVLPERFFEDREPRERFEREAKLLAAVNHPNIAAIHSFEEVSGRHLLVQELLEGAPLREKLGAPLPPRKAIEIAVQVAHGLAAAHEKGIVHRDLKPENLFVTKEGRIKILDFGVAKLTQPAIPSVSLTEAPTAAPGTEPGVVLGTVGYMSPEQVLAKPIDARSDLFSLGVVLYEMLSGKRPFQKDTAPETMAAILREEPPELSETNKAVTPGLDRIVRHCLEKEPGSRFQSARDVAFALESLSGVSIPSAAVAAVSAVPKRKRGVIAAVAISVPLVTLAGGLLFGRRLGKSPPPAYQQVTFKHGAISGARFAPDGQTILYSASWGGRGDSVQVFLKRPESVDAVPVGPPGADLLAVSQSGEMALALDYRRAGRGRLYSGTLARAPLAGGSPRELLEQIQQADWTPDGSALAIVREFEDKSRLEFPPGKVLYETRGHVSQLRFSPKGDAIAFLDHPHPTGTSGSVAVLKLSGEKRTLTSGKGNVDGLAWSPEGEEIWFSTGSIHGVTLSGKERLIARAPGTLRLYDVLPDGRALVSRDTVQLSAFALAPGETRERDLSWHGFSSPRFLSKDGKALLFDEGGGYVTCLGRTDGSPVVRLGEGLAVALSPDGRWALSSIQPAGTRGYLLLPTGAGEARQLSYQGIESYGGAVFLPNGKEILFQGRRGQEPVRFFRGSLEGGTPSPASPPATAPLGSPLALSPDGRRLAAHSNGVPAVISLDAGPDSPPRPIPGASAADIPVVWSEDGRFIYVSQDAEPAMKLFRVDVETGRRTLWKEIMPSDPSGAAILRILLTPDGKSYAYGVMRQLSQLYLVEGLK